MKQVIVCGYHTLRQMYPNAVAIQMIREGRFRGYYKAIVPV